MKIVILLIVISMSLLFYVSAFGENRFLIVQTPMSCEGGSTTTLSASNISAGTFGSNTGGGDYVFPGWVDITAHLDMTGGNIYNLHDIYTSGNVNFVSNITTPYNISAQYYFGDGSHLTGISSSGGFSTDQNDELNQSGDPTFDLLTLTNNLHMSANKYIQFDTGNYRSEIYGYSSGIQLNAYYYDDFITYGYALAKLTRNSGYADFTITSIDNDASLTPRLCLDISCLTASNFGDVIDGDDDNPEAGDVLWSDLTDQGTFTNNKLCDYTTSTGYINCNVANATLEGINATNYFTALGMTVTENATHVIISFN